MLRLSERFSIHSGKRIDADRQPSNGANADGLLLQSPSTKVWSGVRCTSFGAREIQSSDVHLQIPAVNQKLLIDTFLLGLESGLFYIQPYVQMAGFKPKKIGWFSLHMHTSFQLLLVHSYRSVLRAVQNESYCHCADCWGLLGANWEHTLQDNLGSNWWHCYWMRIPWKQPRGFKERMPATLVTHNLLKQPLP